MEMSILHHIMARAYKLFHNINNQSTFIPLCIKSKTISYVMKRNVTYECACASECARAFVRVYVYTELLLRSISEVGLYFTQV